MDAHPGKILQLSVGLPEPDAAARRRLLYTVVPAKAGGRESGGAIAEEKPEDGDDDENGVTIMDSDPLLGFEHEERKSFDNAALFMTSNTRKVKRVANSCVELPRSDMVMVWFV